MEEFFFFNRYLFSDGVFVGWCLFSDGGFSEVALVTGFLGYQVRTGFLIAPDGISFMVCF